MEAGVLSGVELETLSKVLEYDNPNVKAKYSKDFGKDSAHADRAFEAMKQYLALSTLSGVPLPCPEPIDNMWHTFILHTRDYQHFCDKYFGGFVHHQPDEIMQPDSEPMIRLQEAATALFGQLDPEFWPKAAACFLSRCWHGGSSGGGGGGGGGGGW